MSDPAPASAADTPAPDTPAPDTPAPDAAKPPLPAIPRRTQAPAAAGPPALGVDRSIGAAIGAADPPVGAADLAQARFYLDAARAASTRKAYESDWTRFAAWCRTRDAKTLPAAPALVALYLSALAARGLAPPSIARAQAAIADAHTRAGFLPPHRAEGGSVIATMLAGIRRAHASPPSRKDPADAAILHQLLQAIAGDGLAALRDRALLTFGLALAARRAELVALDVADLAWEANGVRVTIRRSKTDPEAAGVVVAVPEGRHLTPLAHLRAWLTAAQITDGPLFRPLWKGGSVRPARLSDHAVARILQARAAAAGLDPSRFAGHSLRAGFITEAARNGAAIWKIQQVSRHRSVQVLAGYVRDAQLFDDHAGETFL